LLVEIIDIKNVAGDGSPIGEIDSYLRRQERDASRIKSCRGKVIIGRGETAHLRPSSDLVSREHCEILASDGSVIIKDLNSRNGTFVNGKQLTKRHKAKSGDSLRVGRLQFEVVIDPVKASTKKPRVAGVVEAASRTAATKRKMSLEDSITDWLSGEDDDEDRGIASAETIQLNTQETSVFGEARKNNSVKAENSEEAKTDPQEKKKLPPVPKFKHEDSTTAADDILKKFFNRR